MNVLLAAVVLAAPPDSSLALRNIHQQTLTFEVWQELEAADATPEDPVEFVQLLADRWAERMADQSAAYRRWSTYPAMSAVRGFYGKDTTAVSQCRVWEQFAVPAFVGDVEDLASAPPSRDRAALLLQPTIEWAYNESQRACWLPADTWVQFVGALRQYAEAADTYLASGVIEGAGGAGFDETYVAARRATALRYLDEAAVEQAVRDGDLGEAFAGLATWVSAGGTAYGADAVGWRLALAYAERGDDDRALAVYDLLARALSDDLLPTATLAAWYARAGAAPDRIDRVRPGTDALLVPSDQTADLSGTFDRVGAEGSLDLSTLRGGLVLLDFWSIYCGPCVEAIPELNRLAETYGDRLTILSVTNDTFYDVPLDAVRQFLDERPLGTTVLTDSEDGALTERFGVAGWPLYLLVDPSGRVLVESREGRRALSLGEVEAYVQALPARP